jgi:transposase
MSPGSGGHGPAPRPGTLIRAGKGCPHRGAVGGGAAPEARLAAREAKAQEPCKDAHHSRVPASHIPKANRPPGPRTGTRREARGGRAGGGRPLHPAPDHVLIAQAKAGPHWGGAVPAHTHRLPAVYDQIELPPVKPIGTQVEPDGGPCPGCGPSYGAPLPVGMEPGPPFGASLQRLATSLRSPHAIRDERLSALLAQVAGVALSEGALAPLVQWVQIRLDHRVEEILTRLRRSRLLCRAETGTRVHGRTPGAWVLPHAEVGVPVLRPRRGHGGSHEGRGDHRPTVGVSDL